MTMQLWRYRQMKNYATVAAPVANFDLPLAVANKFALASLVKLLGRFDMYTPKFEVLRMELQMLNIAAVSWKQNFRVAADFLWAP
jgi:hypothetical protein